MRRSRFGALLFLSLVSVILVRLPAPSQRRADAPARPLRPVVRGSRGAVAGGAPLVTEAGMRLFHGGGNAVDAGVAALFAGAVVEFSHYGWGGEAPILIRTREGRVISIAGVGTAPKLAHVDLFRNRRPTPDELVTARGQGEREGPIPSTGLMPALVPGMVDAGLVALARFGVKTFAEVVQPAIELADGFPIDETRSNSIARATVFLQRWPTSLRVFQPDGKPPRPGEIFRQPALARTLRAMAAAEKGARARDRAAGIEAVRNYFYRGEIARKIDAFSQQNGGLLRYEDLAVFRLEPEEPLQTTYRGYQVYKNGFWTQGAVLLQTLNLLEKYDLVSMRHNSADYLHTMAEAFKLAYADRDSYYGDPKFSAAPEELLSKAYAAERSKLIDPAMASTDFRPGVIRLRPPTHPSEVPGRRPASTGIAANDTTCVNAVDRDGVMFSATPSGAWLPSVIAGDTGIALTQRGQSFLVQAGHPNMLEPGKRPRITLSPTLVTRDGKAFLALSTPGGDNQDQGLIQILLNVVEFGLNPQVAIEAPRIQSRHLVSSFDIHAMHPNSLLVDERIPEAAYKELAARGHKVDRRPAWQNGAAPTVIRFLADTGVIEAGADPYGMRYADAW